MTTEPLADTPYGTFFLQHFRYSQMISPIIAMTRGMSMSSLISSRGSITMLVVVAVVVVSRVLVVMEVTVETCVVAAVDVVV